MHGDLKPLMIDRHLLDRYLAGESSADEIDFVQGWLAEYPDQAARLVRAMAVSPSRIDADWEKMLARTERSVSQHERQEWTRISTISSVVIATLAVFLGWYVGTSYGGRHQQLHMPTYYATGNGQRANITLPDGSSVILNVASRLEVPADYATGNHTVRLLGEALFTVTHHSGSPLTVLAGSIEARVLGTSFVVRGYATDTTTAVAVREGKVAVGNTVVGANRLAEIVKSGMVELRDADASRFTFATGTLTLTSLPLPNAIVELDRWYDADIRLGDVKLAGRRMEGEFAAGSLADLAAILELTYNVRVVRDGRVLTLFPKR